MLESWAMKGRGWHISLLGGLRVTVDGGPRLALPTRKSAALLAYLAIHPGERHSRATLAALLWDNSDDAGARHSLRQALTRLRRALGPAATRALIVDPHAAALNPASVKVDVVAFERLVSENTSSALSRAAELYRGDLLEGFDLDEPPWEEWLRSERTRLREAAIRTLDRLLAHQRRGGATKDAIQTATRLLSLDALREPVHRSLIELYMAEGRRGAALSQYQTCVDILRRELGVEPDRETRRLYTDLVRHPAAAPPTSRKSPRIPATPAPGPSTPATSLVGRQAELTQLREALSAAQRGRGRAMVLTGEAGIGKSRLVQELALGAARRRQRSLIGRAYETTQRLTLGPWVEALGAGGPAVLRQAVSSLGTPWRTELTRLFADLDGDAASTPDAVSEPGRLTEAICWLVVELAHVRPLVLVLEDLHWADDMTLQTVAFVARRIRAAPVLLLVTLRDEELLDAPFARRLLEDLERQGCVSRMRLAPLSRDATVELVRELVRADGAEFDRVAQRIWRFSEGNPFVVIEAARDHARGASDDSGQPIPIRVREMIAGRLAGLGETARQVVAIAAVIGQAFEFRVLELAAGLAQADVVLALEELVRRRVLHAAGERFDFVHERIREVALLQLLRPRRQLLHTAVARALEGAAARPVPAGALGHHYLEGEVWDRATLHLHQAGRQALRRSAFRDAERCLQDAALGLSRLPVSPETIRIALDLQVDRWSAAIGLGDYEASGARADEVRRLAGHVEEPLRRGSAFRVLAYQARVTTGPHRSLDLGLEALDHARQAGNPELRTASELEVGRALFQLGRYRQTVDLLRQTIQSLDGERLDFRAGVSLTAVTSRVWAVQALAALGEFPAAYELGEQALDLADRLVHVPSRCGALLTLGIAYRSKGENDRAVAFLEDAREIASAPDGPGFYLIPTTANLGGAYTMAGRVTEAIPILEDAVARAQAIGDRQGLADLWLGRAYLAVGRLAEARSWIEEAARTARERHSRGQEAWCLRTQGELATRLGDVREAEARYREAIDLGTALEMRPLEAIARLSLAEALAGSGRREEAKTELARAECELAAMGMMFWQPRGSEDAGPR